MKSSIRSKLFLLVYGLILAFIAGLIILNNSFLENYYIRNRNASLIEAFYEIKDYNLNGAGISANLQNIEKDYNINIQVLEQVDEFDPGYVWDGFDNPPIVFERIYGYGHNISDGILSRIIYDFNQQEIENDSEYATEVNIIGDSSYTAFLMDIQSEFNLNNQSTNMIGLVVLDNDNYDNDIYYIMTITFQSIKDSIQIFNSFNIIVGL